jgi:3-dehydroquinate dehydratase
MAMKKLYGNFTHASCKKMCATAANQLTARMNQRDVEEMPKDLIEMLDKLIKRLETDKRPK